MHFQGTVTLNKKNLTEKLNFISEAEQAKIKKLVIDVTKHTPSIPFNVEDYADLDRLNEEYLIPGGAIYAAEDNDKFIGCVFVKKESESVASINRLRVLPDYEGNGIGKGLLERAILFCKESGIQKVILITRKENHRALNMFLHRGFRITTVEEPRGKVFMSLGL